MINREKFSHTIHFSPLQDVDDQRGNHSEERQVIQTWRTSTGKVRAVSQQGQIHFYLSQNGKNTRVPFHWIEGIPTHFPLQIAQWKAFLLDTSVQVRPCGGAEHKLYITPSLKGGGNIMVDKKKVWQDGIVPYEVDHDAYPFNSPERALILEAMQIWQAPINGMQFVPRTDEADFLYFSEDESYCWVPKAKQDHFKVNKQLPTHPNDNALYKDYIVVDEAYDMFVMDKQHIGRQGGRQYIFSRFSNMPLNEENKLPILSDWLFVIGNALGVYPEHYRDDAGRYSTLLPSKGKTITAFAPYKTLPKAQQVGRYDFESVMHPPLGVPLLNGLTIALKFALPDQHAEKIGYRTQLSQGDIDAVRKLAQYAGALSRKTPSRVNMDSGQQFLYSLLPSMQYKEQPQWQKLRDKADCAYQEGRLLEAFTYYFNLLKEYGPIILAHWLAYPLMAYMVSQWYARCSYYFAKVDKNYPMALVYASEGICCLRYFARLNTVEKSTLVGIGGTLDKKNLLQQWSKIHHEIEGYIKKLEYFKKTVEKKVSSQALQCLPTPILSVSTHIETIGGGSDTKGEESLCEHVLSKTLRDLSEAEGETSRRDSASPSLTLRMHLDPLLGGIEDDEQGLSATDSSASSSPVVGRQSKLARRHSASFRQETRQTL